MARLIDGDSINLALVERGQSDKRFKFGETIRYTPSEVQQIINEDMPTVDAVEVVRGKWRFEIGDGKTCVDGWVCTNCNCGFHTNVPYFEEFNFCPNCGADMREEG
jgi:membrane protease subunit (stomatin/prohibitin family)